MSDVIGLTGGTGFIGRHFLMSLLNKGYGKGNLVVLVRRQSPYRGWVEGLGVRLVYGDVGDEGAVSRFVSLVKGGTVVHCAGFVGRDKERLWRVNVLGTRSLLERIKIFGIRRLVYLSSVAVLSGNKELPLRDNMELRASMDYGQSKLEAEKLVWQAVEEGIPAVILRPGMVYGEGEPHMLPWVVNLMKGGLFFLFGKMDNPWHLCGMENLLWIMERAMVDDCMLGRAFICADEQVLTGEEVFGTIAGAVGLKKVRRIPEWMCALLVRVPKISNVVRFMRKARIYDISGIKSVGYRDVISPKEGLVKAVKHALEEVRG